MIWEKLGRVFEAPAGLPWWKSHCMAPSAVLINDDAIRVFVGGWDEMGISRIGYVDLDAGNPLNVLGHSEQYVLGLGDPGMFDDNGVFPGHASIIGGRVYLYYTGFQQQTKIPFTNFGGLAISDPGNPDRFERVSRTPVLDRSDEGTCVRSGQTVMQEDGIWKTWYSAGTEWEEVGGKPRQTYDVYYTESNDGTSFPRKGELCLRRDSSIEHGLGRPQVIRVNGGYAMFYTRRILDMKYTIGYAVSADGKQWDRRENEIGIEHSQSGWDSEMVYFPSVLAVGGDHYLFYTGNNFGETGFGVARLRSWDS